MIISHVRHGRTRRAAINLARHLMKPDAGGPPILHAITGLAATDLPGALHAMRRLAPVRAAAFHHIALSPASDWTADALAEAASRVVREFGGDPASHPHVVVLHRKPSPSGRGSLHAHVVLSHWSGTGPGLRDAWSHLRLERLAREMEWDAGEALTRGRHDRALAKALTARSRSDIAEALTAAADGNGLPRSPITSRARQALGRKGIDDAAARRAVASAWSASETPGALRAALAVEGLRIDQGEKPGVWVVATAAGIAIGALDRIVRQRRAEVSAFMEKDSDRIAPDRVGAAHPENRQPDRAPHAPARPLARAGGAEPARADPGGSDRGAGGATGHPGQPASPGELDLASARRHVWDRVAEKALAAAISIPDIRAEAERRHLQSRLDDVRAFHDAARHKLVLAQEPVQTPASLIQAQARADRSRQASRDAWNAAREGHARLDAVEASRPKGVALLADWIAGRARRRRQEAAQAAEAARLAHQRQKDAEHLHTAFQAALEAETRRVATERVQAAAARRQLAEVAEHEVAVAMRAARMLRAEPSLASLSITDLLWRADEELRDRDKASTGQRPKLRR